MVPEGHPFRN
jgi:hypothetical protein